MSDEKTEEPTEKKLEDAKKKGQNAKSQDITAALSLLTMTLVLSSAAGLAGSRIIAVISRMIEQIGAGSDRADAWAMIIAGLVDAGLAIVPFTATAMAVGIIGSAAQVGLNISFEPVTPKFDKINPAAGLKKLFSIKSVVEFIKTLVKAIALIAILWQVVKGMLPMLMGSVYLTPPAIAILGWEALIKLLSGAVVLFLVIGPLDYGLQLYLFLKDQRMSKDDIKREHKESEGDPQLKGKRKQIAREMANSAPKQAVPGASVVVTNPTHYAVALRYVAGETGVPIVVAKGIDAEALLIRRIAEENNVPIVGDPPLARSLFRVEISEPVPEPLFEAVAAVLRWVALVKGSVR